MHNHGARIVPPIAALSSQSVLDVYTIYSNLLALRTIMQQMNSHISHAGVPRPTARGAGADPDRPVRKAWGMLGEHAFQSSLQEVSTFMKVPSITEASFLILSGFLEAVLESALCTR
jgi:hypothetical protein